MQHHAHLLKLFFRCEGESRWCVIDLWPDLVVFPVFALYAVGYVPEDPSDIIKVQDDERLAGLI